MSKKSKKLREPWRTVHGAVWLIGLAILAWKGWWWPGILVLIAVSSLVEVALRYYIPDAVETPEKAVPAEAKEATAARRAVRLPSECPKCSAPIRSAEVKWTGPTTADCPYCGATLPVVVEPLPGEA